MRGTLREYGESETRGGSPSPARLRCATPGDLSPHAAGESHMDLGLLLPCSARRILKTSPELGRTSDGQIRKGISAAAGPTCGQCKARTFGRAVCRAGCSVVWSGVVRGYGGLRT